MEQEYWIVIAEDETYHQTPDDAENLHRIGLPIVGGPYDDYDEAYNDVDFINECVVSLPKGVGPVDWDER